MPEKPVYLADIADRTIKVRPPTQTQYVLMGRAAKNADTAVKADDFTAAVYSMVEDLDIIDTLIMEDDDRSYLTDLMSKGDLEIEDLLTAIGSAIPKQEQKAKGSATRVTRGRAS